ncbi:MAG TPA: DNA polymerase II [Sandaracinaceae bacterium LLY-WYZ-13_1]|nr:DNA polymerase II [Sandaracinaceae bacterium LLY-WYZ-13_1]
MTDARVERRVFLLTRGMRPRRDGLELTYWGWSAEGPVRARLSRQEAVFFVERGVPTEAGRRRAVALTTLTGDDVDAVYFTDRRAMRAEARRLADAGTPAWEADVKPADRVLIKRFVTAGCVVEGPARERGGVLEMDDPTIAPADVAPELRVASFDVEAEGPEGPLISVAIVHRDEERVFVRGAGPPLPGVAYFEHEAEALRAFLAYVAALDPDVLIGWNVIDFDVAYLEARCRANGIRLSLGRGGRRAEVLRGTRDDAPAVARVPGRVVLDGIATMRAATWSFERWSLEHVAQALLGRGKALEPTDDKLAEILRLYREDLPALIEYNLEDCRLVRDLFAEAHVLEFAIERQRLTGLTMDRRAGAVAAFDHLYLPRLHRHGRVAPSVGVRGEPLASPGGHVMDSVPGLHENVLVLDFKSLYPSIIRTFLVDPLGLHVAEEQDEAKSVEGFAGARFSRTDHILPELIERLWAARDEAKREGDAALSRAIKIQMNSFYGVLGTPACRFFDPRLASSITRRGHEILQRSRAWIEERGRTVIYGDTDSLFVLLGAGTSPDEARAVGDALAVGLNRWWRARLSEEHGVDSALELELETHYARFLMPTTRGSAQGSKKRYAGLERAPDGTTRLVIKGLEAVRTDWTPLARDFQRELLRRVFAGEPYEAWIRETTDALFAGALDDRLVYRKRLRRRLDAYAATNAPPHVVAARRLGRDVREIEYVITVRGPQPAGQRTAPLDHQHYLERQLAPVADTVLRFLGTDFMRLGGRQLSLF